MTGPRAAAIEPIDHSPGLVKSDRKVESSAVPPSVFGVLSVKGKIFIATVLFALCVAPTFISYEPQQFSWDDADYLARAVSASRAFWSGDTHQLGDAVVSLHTPVMTLLGLPWGSLTSAAAAGNCFLSLAILIALLAAASLLMMLRIGVKPIFLVVASICVCASLGPYPAGAHASTMTAHSIATGYMTDNLLAWTTLAALLFIPYEARTAGTSLKMAALHGIACASILSLGALTKVSFFYFVVLIVPIIFLIRLRKAGLQDALAWLMAVICCSAPTVLFFLRYGKSALTQARAASFGGLAGFYHVPMWQFFVDTIRDAPGLGLSGLVLVAAVIYLVTTVRPSLLSAKVLPVLITVGFLLVVLAAPSKQSRYLFPGMVALPFLMSILLSKKDDSIPASRAGFVSAFVLLALVAAALPTRRRDYEHNLARAETVLTQTARLHTKSFVLATDSPTLNICQLSLASKFSSSAASFGTVAYQAMFGEPIQDDFRRLDQSDAVIFQDGNRTNPRFTNLRASKYEEYTRQAQFVPIRISDDITAYIRPGRR